MQTKAPISRFPIPTRKAKALEWPMQPGDAVAFDFRICMGLEATRQHPAVALFRSALLGMMRAV